MRAFFIFQRLTAIFVLLPLHLSRAADTPNGGFESQFEGWNPKAWAHDAGTARVEIDTTVHHRGVASAKLEHRGEHDWSFERSAAIAVAEGDIFEMETWARGEGRLDLSVVTSGADKVTQQWQFGLRSMDASADWRKTGTRFVVPPGVTSIRPRLTGEGPAELWIDDFSIHRTGNTGDLRDKALPAELSIRNDLLEVRFRSHDATFEVLDKRTRRSWSQQPVVAELTVLRAVKNGPALEVRLFHGPTTTEYQATMTLAGDVPELLVVLSGGGELPRPLAWPAPFTGGADLIIPMNEGITYPVGDETIRPMALYSYGGHGICMPWWGLADGDAGHMAIFETPDDAEIRIERHDGKLDIAPAWQSQKGRLAYPRSLRYVFFDKGGYVAMAKRYRHHAKQTGLLKTLEQKRRELPATDLLVGAVNVWCWEQDAPAIVREMRAAGIERILWSNHQSPENIRTLNELGVLTSRYDIYQDTMDPAQFPRFHQVHGDWTTAAWPQDLMRNASGDWIKGWVVTTKDGSKVPCGVLCDMRAPDYARRRISAELKTHPYRSRFIDTTTASPWRECYDPAHPATRTESRCAKMELLGVVSGDHQLVCGSETGHDAAVPFVHYFEGMLSLGPYRVPDAGRDIARIWTEVPEMVGKFQLGERYRLPLWELVYHDCVVAQWYWGDYNNKLPSLWDKRDLFNALYGTPPMFMFDRKSWEKNRDRFVQSYRTTCPIARDTGYSEMTDHRWLSTDRSVQQTLFANGITVTANFGTSPFPLATGDMLAPMSSRVTR